MEPPVVFDYREVKLEKVFTEDPHDG